MNPRIAMMCLSLFLIGCGEDSEEAYQRGYEEGYYDGWAETCNSIEDFSARIGNLLESEKIC